MPDDFVMQLHRFWERQRLPSQPCEVLPQIQVMPLNSLRISLADYVQLSLQAGFIQRPAIVIHITTSKGDSRLIRRPSVAIVRFTNTCAATVFREPVIRVKQPALARFSPDQPHCSSISAQTVTSLPGTTCARGYRLRPEFFKWRKNRVEANAHNAGQLPGIQRHSWPYQWFSGAYRVEKRCKVNCSCHVLRQWEQR